MNEKIAHGIIREKIEIEGIVQGVGFRPFIYSLANRHGLNGFVLNNTNGVIIEVEGRRTAVEEFLSDIKEESPPLSKIEEIELKTLPIVGHKTFTIKPSRDEKGKFVLISPDIAICDECLHELFDPIDRRFAYPFINCTNCGPRFTIIKDIPYDRDKTTMQKFKMCGKCQKEYDDPLNRRFHTQPNACPECGPEVELVKNEILKIKDVGRGFSLAKGTNAVKKTIELLKDGKIVAIKGLGGFHLACDAQNQKAVARLRTRKYRIEKPFAIMARDMKTIKSFCFVNESEKRLLLSEKRPIVLLRKQKSEFRKQKTEKKSDICHLTSAICIADEVAPKQKYYGVMLPYTPLHHLILHANSEAEASRYNKGTINRAPTVLVMTSGNMSEEPISYKNKEAFSKLNHIADYFLVNNREIHIRCDDSVVRAFEGSEIIMRRSRGYVPEPVELPFKLKRHILSCGAELKNTFCLARDNYAFLSHYIGDLENLETLEAFEQGIEHFKHLFSIEPEVIAYDLHPEYLSTKYAKKLKTLNSKARLKPRATFFPIQHHHAHIASCMADNKIDGEVIGVAFDGLGYGTDGNLWGGEFLIADYLKFERVGHLKYIQMPGGVAAIKEPWRMALSYLYHIYGDDFLKLGIEFVDKIDKEQCKVLKNMIIHEINSPLTSSMGRLFDAISALLGICQISNYEGQAAMELEAVAQPVRRIPIKSGAGGENSSPYNYKLAGDVPKIIINPDKMFIDIIEDLKNKTPIEIISARFHGTVADIIVSVCLKIRDSFNLDRVALSGGVFQNMLLLHTTINKLQKNGFNVHTHHKVPPNDGGISLGQAVIASAKMESISANQKIRGKDIRRPEYQI